jgi:hypothetical protein
MKFVAVAFFCLVAALTISSNSSYGYTGGAGARSKMSGGDPTFHSTTACSSGNCTLSKKKPKPKPH